MLARRLFVLIGFVLSSFLIGCTVGGKRNIKSFGRTYDYLQDPERRKKETGDSLLIIEDADFSGVDFKGLVWKNIQFKNCSFRGGYETKLDRLETTTFDDCEFVGVHSFGDMVDVTFRRCKLSGETYVMGHSDSKRLLFDGCSFVGADSNRNRWGAVGGYGEAQFVRCKAKWFDVSGQIKLGIHDCEFEDVSSKHDPREVGGRVAPVLLENCKLRGKFDLSGNGCEYQSLTIRDTVLEHLDLSGATVKGDVLMERVRGGYVNAYVKQAKSLTVRNSQLYGSDGKFFEAYAGGIETVEIDTVIFGGGAGQEPVKIAGGTGADPNNIRPRVNSRIVIAKSTIPTLSTHHVNTTLYRLQGNEIGALDLINSRIDQLELTGNTINRLVDLSNTQVKQSKLQSFVRGQLKLDGSNVRPN
jgi:uncharacterized protein YjbI with pentapeptide repeats